MVSTPIGNLGDMSGRAARALAEADVVACEDTRTTGALLLRLGIRARSLLPYHEHNAERALPVVLARLAAGEKVALVSDAGTPLVSDPGYRLVRAAAAAGVGVYAVPGASALLAALAVAGLPTDRFLFLGFLANKQSARRVELAEIATLRATLVTYESPHRLAESLADMAAVLGGGREAAVCRELTKLYEEVRRGTLADLAAGYAGQEDPKGEVVIVIGPPGDETPPTGDAVDQALREALARGLSRKDAAALVAGSLGLPKREVYSRALILETP